MKNTDTTDKATVHIHELCEETHIGTGSSHRWTEPHCIECGESIVIDTIDYSKAVATVLAYKASKATK